MVVLGQAQGPLIHPRDRADKGGESRTSHEKRVFNALCHAFTEKSRTCAEQLSYVWASIPPSLLRPLVYVVVVQQVIIQLATAELVSSISEDAYARHEKVACIIPDLGIP